MEKTSRVRHCRLREALCELHKPIIVAHGELQVHLLQTRLLTLASPDLRLSPSAGRLRTSLLPVLVGGSIRCLTCPDNRQQSLERPEIVAFYKQCHSSMVPEYVVASAEVEGTLVVSRACAQSIQIGKITRL